MKWEETKTLKSIFGTPEVDNGKGDFESVRRIFEEDRGEAEQEFYRQSLMAPSVAFEESSSPSFGELALDAVRNLGVVRDFDAGSLFDIPDEAPLMRGARAGRRSPRLDAEGRVGLLSSLLDVDSGETPDGSGTERSVADGAPPMTYGPNAPVNFEGMEKDPAHFGKAMSNILPNFLAGRANVEAMRGWEMEQALKRADSPEDILRETLPHLVGRRPTEEDITRAQAEVGRAPLFEGFRAPALSEVEAALLMRADAAARQGDADKAVELRGEVWDRAKESLERSQKLSGWAEEHRTEYEKPENYFHNALLSTIESSGHTITSGIRSGAAWALGGPVAGTIMSMVNSMIEADSEAGEAFSDLTALRASGQRVPDERIQRAIDKVRSENVALLSVTNPLGDVLLFAPQSVGRFAKALASGDGRLAGALTAGAGAASKLIPADNAVVKGLRAGLSAIFPYAASGIPESIEEMGQSFISSQATGRPLAEGELFDSAFQGYLGNIVYGGTGRAIRSLTNFVLQSRSEGAAKTARESLLAGVSLSARAQAFETRAQVVAKEAGVSFDDLKVFDLPDDLGREYVVLDKAKELIEDGRYAEATDLLSGRLSDEQTDAILAEVKDDEQVAREEWETQEAARKAASGELGREAAAVAAEARMEEAATLRAGEAAPTEEATEGVVRHDTVQAQRPEPILAPEAEPEAAPEKEDAPALEEAGADVVVSPKGPVGRHVRSGSVAGRVVAVMPNGSYRLEGGVIVTPGAARNWAERDTPFDGEPVEGDGELQAESRPAPLPESPEETPQKEVPVDVEETEAARIEEPGQEPSDAEGDNGGPLVLPWDQVAPEQDYDYYGTTVLVERTTPDGVYLYPGVVERVLPVTGGGYAVEVRLQGDSGTVRLYPENIADVLEVVYKGEPLPAESTEKEAPLAGEPESEEMATELKSPETEAVASEPDQAEPTETPGATRIKTPGGMEVSARYEVVEASDLTASNLPNGSVNPKYPAALQPRERSREVSRAQIEGIIADLDPERLGESLMASDGAPVVGPDNVVESGNGRTLALYESYRRGTQGARAYRQWLLDNAARFGVGRDDISGAKFPILVRRRTSDVDRVQFALEANRSTVAGMSATEQAQADAGRLTQGILALFVPSESGDLLAGNGDFIRAFRDVAVPQNELNRFVDADGRLSQDGVNRIRNALFAKAYGDSAVVARMSESIDDNVKNIINGLVMAAPQMASIRGEIAGGTVHGLDIANDIVSALRVLSDLRTSGISVEEHLHQLSLFGDNDLTSFAQTLLRFFDEQKRSAKKIGAVLSAYPQVLRAKGDPRMAVLFEGLSAPTKEELFHEARRATGVFASRETGIEQGRLDLAGRRDGSAERDDAASDRRGEGETPSLARGGTATEVAESVVPEGGAAETDQEIAEESRISAGAEEEAPADVAVPVSLENWQDSTADEIESARDRLKREVSKLTKADLDVTFPEARTVKGRGLLDAVVDSMVARRRAAAEEDTQSEEGRTSAPAPEEGPAAALEPVAVRLSFGSYNPRRYSRPWGARITFGGDNRADYAFDGNFLGDDDGGEVVINARPGEIVAFGQKDKRGGRSENDWYVVGPDGSLDEISRADALKHFRQREKLARDAQAPAVAPGSETGRADARDSREEDKETQPDVESGQEPKESGAVPRASSEKTVREVDVEREPEEAEGKVMRDDAGGDDAGDAEPLADGVPGRVREAGEGGSPEAGAGLREADAAGDGRAEADFPVDDGRGGLGGVEESVLSDAAAEDRDGRGGRQVEPEEPDRNRESETEPKGKPTTESDEETTEEPPAQTDRGPSALRDGGKPAPLSGENPGNFRIDADFPLGEGTDGQKIKGNIAAIRTLKKIQGEGRYPTREEQAVLARYVGWGGLKSVFDPKKAGATDMYGRAQAELREILTPEEYDDAYGTVDNAHYTSRGVIDAMWRVARHFGFRGGRVLEPTVGVGNFLGLQPADLAASTEWHASELDSISGAIAAMLYPDADVLSGTGFQVAPFADGAFDLAIGNPPFGSWTVNDRSKRRAHLSGMKIHNYVVGKTGMHLRPGGVMAMVVTHRFLDTANPEARDVLARDFRFLGAFRLPNDAFRKNAGTEVTTDVIFLQKLRPGEKSELGADWLDTDGRITVDGQTMRVNRYYEKNPGHILGRSAMDGSMYRGQGQEYTVHGDGRDLTQAIDELLAGDWADLEGIMTPSEADRNATAALLAESHLPVGGLAFDDHGNVVRRLMDDESGNAVVEVVTAESLWKDQAEEWESVLLAARELKSALAKVDGIGPALEALQEVAAVAYSAKGEKKSSPTKAEQAVYSMLDAIHDAGQDVAWSFDANVEEIDRAYRRKQLGPDGLARIRGMLDLRSRLLALTAAERSDAHDVEALRRDLNKAYDRFVKKYGPVSDAKNVSLLGGDVGAELGLESDYQKAVTTAKSILTGEPVRKASAMKADILSRRIFFPTQEITHAETSDDALKVSLSERGRPDVAYMAKLTGKTEDEVISDLTAGETPQLFMNPASGGYEQADEYLSGNVVAKLAEARRRGLAVNVRALERVQPEPKTKANISPSIRGAWIPAEIFREFLEALGVESPRVSVYSDVGSIVAMSDAENLTPLGLPFTNRYRSITELFNAAAAGKAITVTVKSGSTTYTDSEGTRIVSGLLERLSDLFSEWAFSDEARTRKIVDAFNQKMNTHVKRRFDGTQHLRLVGVNPSIRLRRTQLDAAWRIIQSRSTLLDHVVGAGKTYTIIAGVMERRRLGLSKKPMIVVPNHLVTQWAQDFYRLYPGARILAATPADFTKKNRRRLFARIATGDFDAVIVGHSSFGFIPTPTADQEEVIQEQLDTLLSTLEEARANKESARTLGQIQARVRGYEDKLARLQERAVDDIGFDFETLGIDMLAVDESHEFKNLEYATAAERLVQMNSPEGSKKAFDLYGKIRGLSRRGGSVVFATGTPVSNSLVEVYTIMKYLAHDDLAERGQLFFDAWAGAYTRAETRMEYTATQKLKLRRVLSGLQNIGALRQIYESFADIVMQRDLVRSYAEEVEKRNRETGGDESTRFPVPRIFGGERELDLGAPTPDQEEFMDYLVARMDAIEAHRGDRDYSSIDNQLWVLNDARKGSLDIRTVNPRLPRGENSKVSRAALRIKALYDEWADRRGAQLVFCDGSTPSGSAAKAAKDLLNEAATLARGKDGGKRFLDSRRGELCVDIWESLRETLEEKMESAETSESEAARIDEFLVTRGEEIDVAAEVADIGFSVYDDMKSLLVEMGIPAREIAFIHDYNTPEQKEALFARVNAGYVRVLIGSSAKMGAGMNAQKRLVALHHIDAPWRPSDMEQREGRIVRQGNLFYEADPDGFAVRIIAYSTSGTSDAVLWQVLERKAAAIERFRRGEGGDVIVEETSDADQYAEFMAASTGNPVFRHKMEAEVRRNRLQSEVGGMLVAQSNAAKFFGDYEGTRRSIERTIALYETLKGDPEAVASYRKAADDAERSYRDALKEHEEKQAAADRFLAEWEAAPEATRGKKPVMPVAPRRPSLLSAPIVTSSAYLKAINAALVRLDGTKDTRGQQEETVPFGDMDVTITRSSDSNEGGAFFWRVYLGDPNEFPSLECARGVHPQHLSGLTDALSPAVLEETIGKRLNYARRSLGDLESQKKQHESVGEIQGARKSLDDAEEALDWFRVQVAFAESQADLRREGKPNRFIDEDRKRELRTGGGTTTEESRIIKVPSSGGESFETTGIVVSNLSNLSLETYRGVRFREAVSQTDGRQVILAEQRPAEKGEEPTHTVWEKPAMVAEIEGGEAEGETVTVRADDAAIDAEPAESVEDLKAEVAAVLNEGKDDTVPHVGMGIRVIHDTTRPELREADRAKREKEGQAETLPPFTYRSQSMEDVHQAYVGGERSRSVKIVVQEWLVNAAMAATRTYRHLPHDGFYAEAIETLRRMGSQVNAAQSDAIRYLKAITKGMTREEMDLFNRFVVIDDFAHDADDGLDLPFGFVAEEVMAERDRLVEHVRLHSPKVQAALEQRNRIWRTLKSAYIQAGKRIGVFGRDTTMDEIFSRGDSYFRHRVLKHVREAGAFNAGSPGGPVKATKRRGWTKARKGTQEAINLNYVQAEFEVLSQMIYDTATFEALGRIARKYDMANALKKQAGVENRRAFVKAKAQEAREAGATQYQAEAVAADALEALALLPGIREAEAEIERTLKAAGLDYYRPGSRDWTKLIPEGYVAYEATEGEVFYKAWTIPERMAKDLLEGAFEELGLTADDLRQVIARGQGRDPLILPEEIADQLKEMRKHKERSPWGKLNRYLIGQWKRMVLFFPRRIIKYMFRNFSGDVEGPIMGNFGTFRHTADAFLELFGVIAGEKSPDGELAKWMALGGLESIGTVQELGDLFRDKDLDRLYRDRAAWTEGLKTGEPVKKVWDYYWGLVSKNVSLQESTLRYATYLSYLEQMQKNEGGRPDNFGASNRDFIMGLEDIRDRAYHLSNDLLVAYDMISETGKEIRASTIPFWSFMEGNFKRYIGLMRNAHIDAQTAAKAGQGVADLLGYKGKMTTYSAVFVGKMVLRMSMLTLAMTAWNNLFHKDEEEELPSEVQSRPHMIFGRDAQGRIIYFDRLGALGDFLDWFGLDGMTYYVRSWANGRMTIGEILADMAKSPVNKVASGYNPFLKSAMELLSGAQLYPDAFRARPIRDRGQYLADFFLVGPEFRALTGRPMPGGRYLTSDNLTRAVAYICDPGEAAYWETIRLRSRFMEQQGKSGTVGARMSERSKALWQYKAALRYGDADAATRYLEQYFQYMAIEWASAGKKLTAKEARKTFKRSLESLDPLSGLSRASKRAFWMQLTDRERDVAMKAQDYYRTFLLGTAAKAKSEADSGDADE